MSEHTDFGEGLRAGIRDDVCLSDSMNSTAVDALALRNKTDFDLVLFALDYLYNGGRITARQGNLIGGEINRRLDNQRSGDGGCQLFRRETSED